jgi:uncharacterized protein
MKKKLDIIVDRKREQKILQEVLVSEKSEFVAVYGRRRVGKTYLIKTFFRQKNCVFFHVTGSNTGTLLIQIGRFIDEISKVFYTQTELKTRKTWEEAFDALTKALELVPKNKKIILFFDELPWMATKRSRLIQTLDYYWNRYWVDDRRLKLIICGSSASWIIKNIVNNKGGLHNRITQLIELKPFNLNGTKEFLNYKGVKLNESQILQLYMATGGIPHYLDHIKRGFSATQNIDALCFRKDGLLFKEFNNLFASLFNESEIYANLVKIIAKCHYGISQAQLFKEFNGKVRGGSMVNRLKELEDTGFIISFIPYQHKQKGIHYRIFDEYVLYYIYWIESATKTIQKLDESEDYWKFKINSASWRSWSGYAFESICYKHISGIKKALGISADADVGNWYYSSQMNKKENGAQIDLLFDRSDDAITICEIKYTNQPFAIDKQYAKNLLNKVELFKKKTKTTKQVFIAMISACGLKPTIYSEELISHVVTLNDLFKSS